MSVPERYEHTTESEWAMQKFGIIFSEDIKDEPTIYFDMDGTLAVWNNMSLKNPSEAMTLEEITENGYFRNLQPIPEMIEKARYLKEECHMNVAILSKAYYHAIEEKTEWLKEHMPFIDTEREVFFVPLEAEKRNFIPTVGLSDVLIDDYNENLNQWYGTALKVITDKNSYRDDIPCFSYDMDNEKFLNFLETARDDRIYEYAQDMDNCEKMLADRYVSEYAEDVREAVENIIMEAIANAPDPVDVIKVINDWRYLDKIVNAVYDGGEISEDTPDDFIRASFDKNGDLMLTFEADSTVGLYSYECIGVKLSYEVKQYLNDKFSDRYQYEQAVLDKVCDDILQKQADKAFAEYDTEPSRIDVDALKKDIAMVRDLLEKCEDIEDLRNLRHNGISEKQISVEDDNGNWEYLSDKDEAFDFKDSVCGICIDEFGDNGAEQIMYFPSTGEIYFDVVDKDIYGQTMGELVSEVSLATVDKAVKQAYEEFYNTDFDSIPVKGTMQTFTKPVSENKPKQIGKEQ